MTTRKSSGEMMPYPTPLKLYHCVCPKGYVRGDCSVYSPCTPNVCQHGGTCNPLWRSYRCTCATGYVGTDCETVARSELASVKLNCAFAPCENGGTCEEHINSYSCKCVKPFYSKDCEIKPTAKSMKVKPREKRKKVESSDTGNWDFLTAFVVIFSVCMLIFCFIFACVVKEER
ncbi:hypothetical protein LSAT2_009562 [Lamellibrachia satsuma]|nr:hypothetical protein LSAT2_009562 [Lamellibrachia satsuma]